MKKKRTTTVTTPHNETVREPVNESRSSLNKGSGELRISLKGLISLESGCLKRCVFHGCLKRCVFRNEKSEIRRKGQVANTSLHLTVNR